MHFSTINGAVRLSAVTKSWGATSFFSTQKSCFCDKGRAESNASPEDRLMFRVCSLIWSNREDNTEQFTFVNNSIESFVIKITATCKMSENGVTCGLPYWTPCDKLSYCYGFEQAIANDPMVIVCRMSYRSAQGEYEQDSIFRLLYLLSFFLVFAILLKICAQHLLVTAQQGYCPPLRHLQNRAQFASHDVQLWHFR